MVDDDEHHESAFFSFPPITFPPICMATIPAKLFYDKQLGLNVAEQHDNLHIITIYRMLHM